MSDNPRLPLRKRGRLPFHLEGNNRRRGRYPGLVAPGAIWDENPHRARSCTPGYAMPPAVAVRAPVPAAGQNAHDEPCTEKPTWPPPPASFEVAYLRPHG